MIKTSELNIDFSVYGNKGAVWANQAHIQENDSHSGTTLCGVPMLATNWALREELDEIGCDDCIITYNEIMLAVYGMPIAMRQIVLIPVILRRSSNMTDYEKEQLAKGKVWVIVQVAIHNNAYIETLYNVSFDPDKLSDWAKSFCENPVIKLEQGYTEQEARGMLFVIKRFDIL